MVLAVVILGGGVVTTMWLGEIGPFSVTSDDAPAASSQGGIVLPPSDAEVAKLCPDTLTTVLTLTVRNQLNETGREEYDNTALVYKVKDGKESLVQTLSDTTAGTANLECGSVYRVRLISTDANGGDGAYIFDQLDSGLDAEVSADHKFVEFVAQGSQYSLGLQSKQHGTLQFRVFDNTNNGLMFDAADSSANDYETTGANFSSTTLNTTATAVGAGGDFDMTIQVKSTDVDTDFCDLGCYLLIDAASSKWDDAEVTYGGSSLDVADFDDYENRLWGGTYEQKFVLPANFEDKVKEVRVIMPALAGVNPTGADSPVFAFASLGATRQTSANGVHYGGTDDAAAPTAVYTVQSLTISVS